MKDTDKLQIRTVVVWVFLVIFTILAIYIIYGKFIFGKLPWLRISIIMSVLTCLWAYTLWFCHLVGGSEDETLNPLFFGVAVIPFEILLVLPNPETLGIFKDTFSDGVWTFVPALSVIHGIGFYLIQRRVKQFLNHKGLY